MMRASNSGVSIHQFRSDGVLVLRRIPQVPDRLGPISVEQYHAISNPAPIERFVSEDAYIKQALGTVGTVRFGNNEIGLVGVLTKQL